MALSTNREVLVEHRIAPVKVLESTGDGVFRFEAVVSEANYVNRNRRMYPERVLFPAFDRLSGALENYPGAVDHPDPYSGGSVSDLGIVWEQVWYEGKLVLARGRIIPTAKGRDLQAAMEAGVPIGFSTRGRGHGKEEQLDGQTVLVMEELELETVADAVINPSVRHARIRSYTKEDLDTMEQELNEAQQARQAAEARATELEAQVAEATSRAETAEASATVAAQRAETAEARVAELEAEIIRRDADLAESALEAKLITLTAEHRFGVTIRDQARELGVTLENAERVVAALTALIEAAASASNENLGSPRGDLSTHEDDEPAADPYTPEQREELERAGLI